MNENLLQRFPTAIRTLLGRMATSKTMLKSLRAAQLRGERGLLHPMDWSVEIEEPAEGGHRTTWTQCGALQALRASGDDCCNNYIAGPGFTEWAPEKGFEHRK